MFTPNTRPFRTEGKSGLITALPDLCYWNCSTLFQRNRNCKLFFASDKFSGAFSSHNFDGTLRQGVQERLSVALYENTVIQHDHNALVRLGTDKPSRPLPEFENGLRQ